MNILLVRRSHSRTGMTLLELLLALALCGLLLTATGASLHLMMQLRSRSQTQISETQTVRALLDQVARDLRSIRRIAAIDETTASSAQRLDQTLDLRRTQLNLQPSQLVPVELFGTATWLSLHTDHSGSVFHAGSHARPQSIVQAGSKQFADGLHVIWWNGESRTIPYASDDFRILEARVQGLSKSSGPSRVSFPLTQRGDQALLSGEPLVLDAEMRFRYFDGAVWRDSWDSTECRCLPRAIECRVTQGRDKSESMVISLTTSDSLTSVREPSRR